MYASNVLHTFCTVTPGLQFHKRQGVLIGILSPTFIHVTATSHHLRIDQIAINFHATMSRIDQFHTIVIIIIIIIDHIQICQPTTQLWMKEKDDNNIIERTKQWLYRLIRWHYLTYKWILFLVI